MPDGGAGGHTPDPDDIERRLRELTEEVGRARIHEPSARERAAAAKQAHKRARRGRWPRVLAVAVVIVVLAGGGAFAWLRIHPPSWLHLAAARGTPSAAPLPKVSPGQRSPRPATVKGPPADPFAGSPADGWADGQAGITIPAARAHGPYTAAQVAGAYAQARTMLIAMNLDPATLRGGYPSALAKLLVSKERTVFLDGLNKVGLKPSGIPVSTRIWTASFAPGTRFLTTVVKTSGTMSARVATVSGGRVLSVEVNYVFVYAVASSHDAADWLRVVDHAVGTIDFATWYGPTGKLAPWDNVGISNAGIVCGTDDGYIHPAFPNGPPASITPSGPPVDPYATATPSPSGSAPANNKYNCQRTTGT